jgi:hypothetical protein
VFNTALSSEDPALSRMRGLWTLPSVPMIKLTVILASASGSSINGFGVASACGGWVASQGEWVVCGTAANSEASSDWRSEVQEDAPGTEAQQTAEAEATRRIEQNLRSGMFVDLLAGVVEKRRRHRSG